MLNFRAPLRHQRCRALGNMFADRHSAATATCVTPFAAATGCASSIIRTDDAVSTERKVQTR